MRYSYRCADCDADLIVEDADIVERLRKAGWYKHANNDDVLMLEAADIIEAARVAAGILRKLAAKGAIGTEGLGATYRHIGLTETELAYLAAVTDGDAEPT